VNKTSIAMAEHYAWGDGCDGWILLDGDDLTVIEECVPAGKSETRHRHASARQFFYVLRGEATLEIDGNVHVLDAGEGIHVPAGAAHQLRNAGPVDVRFLVVSSPDSHGDRSEAPA
jgi:quercetin dioxygenase-like cupin family protein